MYKINITEQMTESGPREMITNDNLNALIDAKFTGVIPDEENVKNLSTMFIMLMCKSWLAKTTLRNIIGTPNEI